MLSSTMRIAAVELIWLDLTLRQGLVTAAGTHLARPVVMVRVLSDSLEGFGECAALEMPSYSEEDAAGAWRVLRDYLAPAVLAASAQLATRGPAEAEPGVDSLVGPLIDACGCIRGNPMAKAALEMALVDLALRDIGISLADHLRLEVTDVACGGVLGMPAGQRAGAQRGAYEDPAALIAAAEEVLASGCARLRVKIRPGYDIAPLSALRERFPDLAIQADANGSYVPGDLAILERLDAIGLTCIEEPLGEGGHTGHAWLAERIATPVCLDESLGSLHQVREAISLGACRVACLKPSRLGGLIAAVEAHDLCAQAGVACFCGGMLETSYARIANAAYAGLPGFVLPGDLAVEDRFMEPDILDPGDVPPAPAGRAGIYRPAGLAPHPVANLLAARAVRRELLRL